MEIIETPELTKEQKQELLSLWNKEYPERLKHADLEEFNHYLSKQVQKKHYILKSEEGKINGWAFLFEREKETWFALILDSKLHGKGFGTSLVCKMQESEETLCGWVIDHNKERKQNGEMYKSPLGFYLERGFTVARNERLETDKISAVKIVWVG